MIMVVLYCQIQFSKYLAIHQIKTFRQYNQKVYLKRPLLSNSPGEMHFPKALSAMHFELNKFNFIAMRVIKHLWKLLFQHKVI